MRGRKTRCFYTAWINEPWSSFVFYNEWNQGCTAKKGSHKRTTTHSEEDCGSKHHQSTHKLIPFGKYDLQYPNRGLAVAGVRSRPGGVLIAAPTLCFEKQECGGAAVERALGGNHDDGIEDITMFTVWSWHFPAALRFSLLIMSIWKLWEYKGVRCMQTHGQKEIKEEMQKESICRHTVSGRLVVTCCSPRHSQDL